LASLRPKDFKAPGKVDFSLRANMQVANVQKKFKENFGLEIQIYKLSKPDEKDTLASLRKSVLLSDDAVGGGGGDENELVEGKNYIIDYNKAAYADTILWTDEENSITDLEPFIDFIRCDYDGEDYAFLYSDEDDFSVLDLVDFAALTGDDEDTYLLCYVARIQVDLENHPKFRAALSYSENQIEVVLGFKKDGEKLEDCYEPHSNIPTELQKED